MSGPHDFAVRKSSTSSARRIRVHRIPPPTSVTIAKRPFLVGRDGNGYELICCFGKAEYFCRRDLTGFQ
ncbi:MAG: hypothetical protein E7813_01530 [Bradyrhizobium sp.]|nr:MAG: hypothetical protein E7813_01530 [Bradyrhizobium sp.]